MGRTRGAFVVAMLAVTLACLAAPAPSLAVTNARRDWCFIAHAPHVRAGAPRSAVRLLDRYHGIWIGPRRHKVAYLTFDAGYERGTMRRLVGILDRAHVTATFFLTGEYMRANPGLTRSITRHGHLIGSHSYSHPYMTSLAGSPQAFARQFRRTEQAYHAATGGQLAKFFRAPYGTYSARVLSLTRRLGYTSVFWSFAHVDWETGDQPPVSVTRTRLLAAGYPGVVYLLHACSTSNLGALPAVIHRLKQRGFTFATVEGLARP